MAVKLCSECMDKYAPALEGILLGVLSDFNCASCGKRVYVDTDRYGIFRDAEIDIKPIKEDIRYSVSVKQCIIMPVQAHLDDKVIAAIELHVAPYIQNGKHAVMGRIQPRKLWIGEIYRMWTAVEHRRRGIMTKLLQICKEGAAIPEEGIMYRLMSSVEDSTEQGKTFLRHHGFNDELVWVNDEVHD